MEETKKCLKCGEIKPLDAFSPNPRAKDKHKYHCKECASNAQKERYRLMSPKEKKDQRQRNFKKSQFKRRRCAKALCPKAAPSTIELICPVCGKKYGKLKYAFCYETSYCSKECYWESMRKQYREKSPYAQNIKRIRKEQKL